MKFDDTLICELSHYAVLRCAGDDAQSFLQAQLTNDVSKANQTTSQLTAYCTPKGRMLAFIRCGEQVLYTSPLMSAEKLSYRLRKRS